MFKRIIGVALVCVLLITLIPSSAFGAGINQDVSVSAPIYENMETISLNLTTILTQLTSTGKAAVLSTDAAQGKFSWQIKTTSETPNPYANYTLVGSNTFNIADYSSITVWVKPANGASWVSFSTNGVLIINDKDNDGQFEVGSDLTSGKWTQLTLDLTKTTTPITTGQNLIVRTNDNSTWNYDEVTSQSTHVTSLDLTKMASDPYGNLLVNGNFKNGTTGWAGGSVSGGILSFTITGQWGGIQNTNPISVNANDKVYFAAKVKNPYSTINLTRIGLRFAGGLFTSASAPISSDFALTSAISVIPAGGSSIFFVILDASANGFLQIQGKDAVVVDLTTLFGAGNEPTKTWCDTNITYTNATSGGELAVTGNGLGFKLAPDGTTYNINPSVVASSASPTLTGKLTGITIDSGYTNASGGTVAASNIASYPTVSPTIYDFSGNGQMLYYMVGSSLYSMDMNSGISTLVSSSLSPLTSISSLKVNYDGTVIAIYGTSGSNIALIKYDTKATTKITSLISVQASAQDYLPNGISYISTYYILYDIQDSGGIVFNSYYSTITYYSGTPGSQSNTPGQLSYCDPTSNAITSLGSTSVTSIALDNDTKNLFCYLGTSLMFCGTTKTQAYAITTVYTSSSAITGLLINNDGDTAYYISNGILYSYNMNNSILRNFSINTTSLIRMLDNNRILLVDALGKYVIYNPITNEKETLSVTANDIDNTGNVVLSITPYVSVTYRDTASRENKYLLSFDGKNTWYSHKGGTWTKVCTIDKPSAADFVSYGMTVSEVNGLTSDKFAPLYENGNEIYSVDVGIYFISGSTYVSPRIKSIKIITDANSYGDSSGTTANPLLAVKKQDFTGSVWRKVNRIYPVEICNKASDYVYFIYLNSQYIYYNGTSWVSTDSGTITTLITNMNNWAMLAFYGMTAEKVRAIPASALTSQLAGHDFSVVYCMRVPDLSTVGYSSVINVDYTPDLYTSNILTLNVTYTNGTTGAIIGVSAEQVEDFMAWLLSHTSKSTDYYDIKIGTVDNYINYYTVSKVSVTQN